MRRYIVNSPFENLPTDEFDVVIAGGGLSGLYTALEIDNSLKVAVLVKTTLIQANSFLAQGGIAAAVKNDDSPEIHYKDTLRASAGLANTDHVKVMVENGAPEIKHLAVLGVNFDSDGQGNWLTTSEGAHKRARILHCGGDATGKLIMEQMIQLVQQRGNIVVFENHFLTDIITDSDDTVAGVVAFHTHFRVFKAPHVVLATGGIGGIYQYSTNHSITTGDGIAAALRAGARLQNMEFVQFHPTAFYNPGNSDSLFLISEAVRGEGGILKNHRGEAFMQFRHKFKDLAPRDVVSREIFREMNEDRKDHVFLDIRNRGHDFLQKRFPTIFNHLKENGIVMHKDLIPVLPAQHYFMGGVKTNGLGETSVKGLYACGEAACTGVHGANRLASNSLLECVVFGARVARTINRSDRKIFDLPEPRLARYTNECPDVKELALFVRKKLQDYGGIARSPQGLVHALDHLTGIMDRVELSELKSTNVFELLNMSLVGREILLAALARRESIGSHYLEEEPEIALFPVW
jgi:L-aspartate oxidase